MSISRRDLLKFSISSVLGAVVTPFVFSQSGLGAPAAKGLAVDPKLDGTVTYNAGWVVPLEDRAGLLELEAKKNKEHEELKKGKSAEVVSAEPPKEKPKSFMDKVQGFVGKVKNFF
jgi:hypothetical protein